METKENMHDAVRKMATIEVSWSIRWVSNWLLMCSEVMTNRQNPSRLAEVPSICGDVLLAIFSLLSLVKV